MRFCIILFKDVEKLSFHSKSSEHLAFFLPNVYTVNVQFLIYINHKWFYL